MPNSNLRLLPPHAMRLAQMHTELGAHACSQLSGGYDLINELFYKLYDDILGVIVPDPSQLDESAAKLYKQLKNFGSEDTSGAVSVSDQGSDVERKDPLQAIGCYYSEAFEDKANITVFYVFGVKVREVVFETMLSEPVNKVTYPWWKVRDADNRIRAYISETDDVFTDWPDVKMVWTADAITDCIEFSSDYPAPSWWLEHFFSNKGGSNAPVLPT